MHIIVLYGVDLLRQIRNDTDRFVTCNTLSNTDIQIITSYTFYYVLLFYGGSYVPTAIAADTFCYPYSLCACTCVVCIDVCMCAHCAFVRMILYCIRCVCVCVCVCVHACLRAYVRACVRACVCVQVYAQ